MNRAKWKLAGYIPIAQHAWICFQSNIHSEFFCVSKVWLLDSYSVTASWLLLRPGSGSSSPTSAASHMHCLMVHFSLTVVSCPYIRWWYDQTCIPLPILLTSPGKFPTTWCPSGTLHNKPCHWLHWILHCLPGWALSLLAHLFLFPHLLSLSWSLAL